MRILVATTNPHKVQEIQAIFESLRSPDAPAIELVTLAQINRTDIEEPVEDLPTFEGNAAKKALHYARASGHWCLADDSGLEVDALDGEPGVRSARYAGVTGPRSVVDPANNALLMQRLHKVPAFERTARFVCAMALAAPDQSQPLAIVRGTVEGQIIGPGESPRGEHGFGYDPLFIITEFGRTTAELDPQMKNTISHRGRASRLMYDLMQNELRRHLGSEAR
jgi:XTP/dITP diphosphohydrolase